MRFAQALEPTTMNCRNASVRHAPTRIDGTTVNQLNSFDSSCPSFTPPAAGSENACYFRNEFRMQPAHCPQPLDFSPIGFAKTEHVVSELPVFDTNE
ncbi:MAG: hypothetical protein DME82_05365 [Verrucomicrobia bacterium]|nr:MAG: hypothetical protein DME82_05365 [Verrucomicrobiota bacterium]